MPCGKRSLVKSWDKPRHIEVITPSRYEQNEASVKLHWKKVIKDLELSYKDDQVNHFNHKSGKQLQWYIVQTSYFNEFFISTTNLAPSIT